MPGKIMTYSRASLCSLLKSLAGQPQINELAVYKSVIECSYNITFP